MCFSPCFISFTSFDCPRINYFIHFWQSVNEYWCHQALSRILPQITCVWLRAVIKGTREHPSVLILSGFHCPVLSFPRHPPPSWSLLPLLTPAPQHPLSSNSPLLLPHPFHSQMHSLYRNDSVTLHVLISLSSLHFRLTKSFWRRFAPRVVVNWCRCAQSLVVWLLKRPSKPSHTSLRHWINGYWSWIRLLVSLMGCSALPLSSLTVVQSSPCLGSGSEEDSLVLKRTHRDWCTSVRVSGTVHGLGGVVDADPPADSILVSATTASD